MDRITMTAVAWPWRRPRVGLGFSERFLLAVGPGEGGNWLRREVPAGLVVPGTVTLNIASVRDVARLASEMIDELGGRRGTVDLALPDLSVVSALFPSSRRASGADRTSGLGSRLGFPASEARSDSWRGRKGEVLAAAVRDPVVRQYEQVIEAAECRLGWVDGASLVRIPSWAAGSTSDSSTQVRVQLYAAHYFLAVFRGGELMDVRTRLRSGDDVDTVAEDLIRLPATYETESFGTLALSGEGAEDCARALQGAGSLGRVSALEESEELQLASALRALLGRS